MWHEINSSSSEVQMCKTTCGHQFAKPQVGVGGTSSFFLRTSAGDSGGGGDDNDATQISCFLSPPNYSSTDRGRESKTWGKVVNLGDIQYRRRLSIK